MGEGRLWNKAGGGKDGFMVFDGGGQNVERDRDGLMVLLEMALNRVG